VERAIVLAQEAQDIEAITEFEAAVMALDQRVDAPPADGEE
jgi:hypothetical protein